MFGRVKRIVREKGFGFITADDGTDVFFHKTGMESPPTFDKLSERASVSFDVDRNNPKGPRAVNVRPEYRANH